VYAFAVRRLDLPPGATWMVAAHGWDIAGRTRVELHGAFVARSGQSPDPLARPEIVADDLPAIAHAVLATETPASP